MSIVDDQAVVFPAQAWAETLRAGHLGRLDRGPHNAEAQGLRIPRGLRSPSPARWRRVGWTLLASILGWMSVPVIGAEGPASSDVDAPATWTHDEVQILSPIVVSATRVGLDPFVLPVAIDVIPASVIQNQTPQARVSEVLPRLPGTVVTHRGTLAQEEQIMIRGFGGRTQFGTRGVKLIADGIPASTPDGQGGAGLFDLSSARDIEVMRGAFSALYGNHAGGVVQVFTKDGPPRPTLSFRLLGGSDAT